MQIIYQKLSLVKINLLTYSQTINNYNNKKETKNIIKIKILIIQTIKKNYHYNNIKFI